ncbi:MAG TPA: hypothetical protein VFF43_12490, partial [Caldimonas sp.]|nr:hypothetical protein [Caldimonas sp.]
MKSFPAAVVAALLLPMAAHADDAADVAALRKDMEALRASYEARLQALEQRLKNAEAALAAAPAAANGSAPQATAAAPPAAVAPAPQTAAAAPPAAAAAAGGGANSFNPAVSLILSGLYAHTTHDPAQYALRGFPLPADAPIGPGTRGFSLAETELGLAASIDPWLRGQAAIS